MSKLKIAMLLFTLVAMLWRAPVIISSALSNIGMCELSVDILNRTPDHAQNVKADLSSAWLAEAYRWSPSLAAGRRLGTAYLFQDSADQALAVLEPLTLSLAFPSDMMLTNWLIEAYRSTGRWEMLLAETGLKEVVPDRARSRIDYLSLLHTIIAKRLLEHNQIVEAREQLMQAIVMGQREAAPYSLLAELDLESGNIDDAVKNYRQSFRFGPSQMPIRSYEQYWKALAIQLRQEGSTRDRQRAMQLAQKYEERASVLSKTTDLQGNFSNWIAVTDCANGCGAVRPELEFAYDYDDVDQGGPLAVHLTNVNALHKDEKHIISKNLVYNGGFEYDAVGFGQWPSGFGNIFPARVDNKGLVLNMRSGNSTTVFQWLGPDGTATDWFSVRGDRDYIIHVFWTTDTSAELHIACRENSDPHTPFQLVIHDPTPVPWTHRAVIYKTSPVSRECRLGVVGSRDANGNTKIDDVLMFEIP